MAGAAADRIAQENGQRSKPYAASADRTVFEEQLRIPDVSLALLGSQRRPVCVARHSVSREQHFCDYCACVW